MGAARLYREYLNRSAYACGFLVYQTHSIGETAAKGRYCLGSNWLKPNIPIQKAISFMVDWNQNGSGISIGRCSSARSIFGWTP